MNAASSKFRAGVVVQVLVLILVPLFPFCYAIPIPPGQAPGGPRAPSVPQSTSFESLVTPPDSYNSGLATPSSVRSPNDNDLATQTHPTGSSSSIWTPTRYIHHYIDFPDYPDDSDFLSLENVDPNPTNRSPTNAEKKVRQLIEVRKEVLNTLVTYIDKVDLEEVSNPRFTERFGHKFRSRIDSAPGDEVHANLTTKVYDEIHGQILGVLSEEKWLVTVRKTTECKDCRGRVMRACQHCGAPAECVTCGGPVQGAKVRDVPGATYPTLPQPKKSTRETLRKVFGKLKLGDSLKSSH
ncbi:hypothetical protein FB446DRAFT_709121 [Lentinula raphanica]|nr:hypothetical protein FB446DRAFT_709121 [Lentinula raphanica]